MTHPTTRLRPLLSIRLQHSQVLAGQQPPILLVRAVCHYYNTMPLTAVMQAIRANKALSQQESKCLPSKLNKAWQELMAHSDVIVQQEYTTIDYFQHKETCG
jgi:hypothetical protein